jgi:hypothetical protein
MALIAPLWRTLKSQKHRKLVHDEFFLLMHCFRLQCNGGSSREACCSVTVVDSSTAFWHCFRATCGWSGRVGSSQYTRNPFDLIADRLGAVSHPKGVCPTSRNTPLLKRPPKLPRPQDLMDLTPEALEFFKQRKISEATLARNKVKMQLAYCPQQKAEVPAIMFPYYREGALVNAKYRAPGKLFWQVRSGLGLSFFQDISFWSCTACIACIVFCFACSLLLYGALFSGGVPNAKHLVSPPRFSQKAACNKTFGTPFTFVFLTYRKQTSFRQLGPGLTCRSKAARRSCTALTTSSTAERSSLWRARWTSWPWRRRATRTASVCQVRS